MMMEGRRAALPASRASRTACMRTNYAIQLPQGFCRPLCCAPPRPHHLPLAGRGRREVLACRCTGRNEMEEADDSSHASAGWESTHIADDQMPYHMQHPQQQGAPERQPLLPGSAYFLHTSNDSLPHGNLPSQGPQHGTASEAAARARRHANLASSLVQFVAKLPPPSPGSAAESLRSRLGRRLSVPALGEWVAQATATINDFGWVSDSSEDGSAVSRQDDSSGGEGREAGREEGAVAGRSLGSGPPLVDETMVEAMLATQPQLLAQDSQVLAARLRCLAQLLHLPPAEAVRLVAARPGLLLLDAATLERRLGGLAAALGLPDRAAAAAMARNQPVWLYADLPPPP